MNRDIVKRNLIYLEIITIATGAISIPALIPTFQSKFSLSISQSAAIPIIATMGGLVANLLISFLGTNIGLKRINMFTIILGILSSIIIAYVNDIRLFYIGMTMSGVVTTVGLSNCSNIFAHLPKRFQNYGFFHACFGIGGIVAPAIIGYILSLNLGYKVFYLGLAIIYLVLLLIVQVSSLFHNTKYNPLSLQEMAEIVKRPFVFLILLTMIIYAGAEQGIITWSGNLFVDGFGFSKEKASFLLSIFWVVFTLGRISTQFIEEKLGRLKIVVIFASLTILLILGLLFTNISYFFILIGFSLSVVFPILQKYTSHKLSSREVGLFNGLLFSLINISNMLFVGIMGKIGDVSIRFSYFSPVIANIAIIIIILLLHKINKKNRRLNEKISG